jgi:hypothetical protein
VRHAGSCHCRAVVVEVEAPPDLIVYECNCSMCARTGYLHLIVPADRFSLRAGSGSPRSAGTCRCRPMAAGLTQSEVLSATGLAAARQRYQSRLVRP